MPGSFAYLEVIDNGLGMDTETRTKILLPVASASSGGPKERADETGVRPGGRILLVDDEEAVRGEIGRAHV